MSQLSRFDFSLAPGQQIDAVIKIPREDRGVIQGAVVDENNNFIEDAVVKLFEVEDVHREEKSCCLTPVTHTFTDDCGQFLFGPLCCGKVYAVKVWVNDVCLCSERIEMKSCGECIKPVECCCECQQCCCADDEHV